MNQRCVFIQKLVLDGPLGIEPGLLSVHGVMHSSVLEERRIEVSTLTDLVAAALWPHTERERLPMRPPCHEGEWRFGLTALFEGRHFDVLHDLKAREVHLVRRDDDALISGAEQVEAVLQDLRTKPPPGSDSDIEHFAWLDHALVPKPPPRGSSDTCCIAWLARAGLMVVGAPLRPKGIRRYAPLRLLRRDAFTRTDLAYDLHLQRHVWLRRLRAPWSERAETREAFLAMGARQARSEEHFLPIIDMDADAQDAWHVLSCDLERAETLEPRGWRQSGARQVISSLNRCADFMEESGVIHGALEPTHVVFEYRRLRLSDPGIASAIRDAAPADLLRRLPPSPWTAPEVRSGEPPEVSSDIFSLGVMLQPILAAVDPGEDASSLAELEALIARMISRDPRARPRRWSDVRIEIH